MMYFIGLYIDTVYQLLPWLGIWIIFWFIASLIKKRNDVADLAWGLGFIGLSWLAYLTAPSGSKAGLLVSVLVTLWGLRLASHIYTRLMTRPEDARYAAWRVAWGSWATARSFFQVYVLQTVLLLVIITPVLWTVRFTVDAFVPVVIGTLVWLLGFLFEMIGDAQLSAFIRQPENRGTIMQQGLWKYSRHPNYFGEMTQWWGLWIIALSAPFGWASIIGPLTITILLVKVSGVPLLEKKYEGNKEYDAYKKRTNTIFPWPPKKQ